MLLEFQTASKCIPVFLFLSSLPSQSVPFLPTHSNRRGLPLHLITLSDTHSVELCTKDRPSAGTLCTWQHSRVILASSWMQTGNSSMRAIAELCPTPLGHLGRRLNVLWSEELCDDSGDWLCCGAECYAMTLATVCAVERNVMWWQWRLYMLWSEVLCDDSSDYVLWSKVLCDDTSDWMCCGAKCYAVTVATEYAVERRVMRWHWRLRLDYTNQSVNAV